MNEKYPVRDSITDEMYWPQKELVRRFKGLARDFNHMTQCISDIAAKKYERGDLSQEDYDAYLKGVEDTNAEIAFAIGNRFPEIERIIREEKE